MLRVSRQYIYGLRYPVYASLTLSFASFGDAFLYPFLPQYAGTMQIPVVWIGVLLSVNRVIRIVFNPLVVLLFAKYGVRETTIAASLMAVISTIGYGLGWGLTSLLLFRLLWGMSYAILRISTITYAFEHRNAGISLGTSKSLQELGPLFSLWIGPLLLIYFTGPGTFIFLALLSIPALLFALRLPSLHLPASKPSIAFGLPSLFNFLTFLVSYIVEGKLVVVLGIFLSQKNIMLTNVEVTALAAGYLGYRRICFILLAPVSGAIADRIGFKKLFSLSLVFIIAGLFVLLNGWAVAGILLIFTFNAVNSAMAPGVAAVDGENKIRAVAMNATWRDIGAAIGTLTGGLLLSGSFLFETFLIGTFVLAVVLVLYYKNNFNAWNSP